MPEHIDAYKEYTRSLRQGASKINLRRVLSKFIGDEAWRYLLTAARQHRIHGALFEHTLKISNELPDLPDHISSEMCAQYSRLTARRSDIMTLIPDIAKRLSAASIPYAVVKGPWSYLHVWRPVGTRFFNDLDILIDRADAVLFSQVLKDLGFAQGRFDRKTGKFSPATVEERRKFALLFTHPHPWIRIENTPDSRMTRIEPRYDVSWPGTGGRRIPHVQVRELLSDPEVEYSPDGTAILGLADPKAALLLCLEIFRDTRSVLSIKSGSDCRLDHLLELTRLLVLKPRVAEQLLVLAHKSDSLPYVAIAAHYLSQILGEGKLLDMLPNETLGLDLLNQYGRGEGFDHPQGGVWNLQLSERFWRIDRAKHLR